MSLRVNNNIAALNAYRNLSVTDGEMSKSLEKLSSGFRINRAADDAAGLSISEGLRSQVSGLKVAVRNAQDGISVVQTAEGALNETTALLQRIRDLAVQSANTGGNDDNARNAAASEVTQDLAEIDRISASTRFGNKNLLAGDGSGGDQTFTFQVGSDASADNQVTVTIGAINTAGLGLADATAGTTVADKIKAGDASAITDLDSAISKVSSTRADLGAYQNRLEHTINNLSVTQENLTASESRIRDTDMAQEMTSFTRDQILTQAGTAMLAQANQSTSGVLQLLRG